MSDEQQSGFIRMIINIHCTAVTQFMNTVMTTSSSPDEKQCLQAWKLYWERDDTQTVNSIKTADKNIHK